MDVKENVSKILQAGNYAINDELMDAKHFNHNDYLTLDSEVHVLLKENYEVD